MLPGTPLNFILQINQETKREIIICVLFFHEMASQVIKMLGPCGGGGGVPKNMDPIGVTRIVKISVRHDEEVINAITVHFLRNSNVESTERWGGTGGDMDEFNLGQTEYITSVKGYCHNWGGNFVVKSLKFMTNHMKTFGPYGKEDGIPFELSAICGEIIGFHGRSSEEMLHSLGVYVRVPNILKLGPCGGEGGDERNMDCNGISRITKIRIRSGENIDGIQFHFLQNGRESKTELWGRDTGSDTSEFELDPTEYITCLKGHYDDCYNKANMRLVRSITFETNLRDIGPVGRQRGVYFELPAVKGGEIIGFHGRSGFFLDSLGVYVKVASRSLPSEISQTL